MATNSRFSPATIASCSDRRGGGERADAQRADMHPGSGGELEVLGQPAVERDALGGIGRIDQAHRVARAVEALLVERRGGEIGPLPVARRHVRAAHAHFELAAARHQLDLDARHRHADRAGAVDQEMGGGRERRRLGRAPGGGQRERAGRSRAPRPARAASTSPAAAPRRHRG